MKVVNLLTEAIQSLRIVSSPSRAIPPSSAITAGALLGTHDGNFHCDEALALSLLTLHPQYHKQPFEILRTRNPEYLKLCDLVVDVGAVYDPSTHRYDHHQREFTGTFSEKYQTKLSSAGLVYKHFGKEILKNILMLHREDAADESIDSVVESFYEKIYKDFMEHIDAIDNGVSVSPSGEVKYHISTTLSSRVNRFNPPWNEPFTSETLNERFKEAMILTGTEFVQHVLDLYTAWWPARSLVQKALSERSTIEHNEEGKIAVLSIACPWKDHLFDLEGENDRVIYMVYPDSGGSWRIQAVPVTPNSFDSRKKLPEKWCGLRDQQLSEKVGIGGCIFIHASGFIGGHQTKEGALHLAREALRL